MPHGYWLSEKLEKFKSERALSNELAKQQNMKIGRLRLMSSLASLAD